MQPKDTLRNIHLFAFLLILSRERPGQGTSLQDLLLALWSKTITVCLCALTGRKGAAGFIHILQMPLTSNSLLTVLRGSTEEKGGYGSAL